MTKKPTGWQRESARHSLAARGLGTMRKGKPGDGHSAPIGAQNAPKESLDEVFEYVCGQIEETASREASIEEGAEGLLTDDRWLEAHIQEIFRGLEIDESVKAKLNSEIHKRYQSDGK